MVWLEPAHHHTSPAKQSFVILAGLNAWMLSTIERLKSIEKQYPGVTKFCI
jgi:hypothetical protein